MLFNDEIYGVVGIFHCFGAFSAYSFRCVRAIGAEESLKMRGLSALLLLSIAWNSEKHTSIRARGTRERAG